MKNSFLYIAAISIIAVSCSKRSATNHTTSPTTETIITEDASLTTGSAGKSTSRPFKGSLTYQLNTSLGLPCNCGPLIPLGDFEGTGTVTHMGLLKAKNKTCAAPIIVNGNYVGNRITAQCASFTAANGDQIFCNIPPYDLYFTAQGVATGTLEAEFTGGTGRFANATGSFTGTMTVPLSNPNTAVLSNINGTIGY
ncbi:hypothetical protein CAP35_12060 [Chitinophagaceae bacterium IBVUCB1]|nr:hypothetical protein CAP35_12060 [Chitinophagaceae bacterium IBVUCB1]